jgi:DNA-damage-inducible protein J
VRVFSNHLIASCYQMEYISYYYAVFLLNFGVIMDKVIVQSRVSPELKEEAEKILAGLGMTTAEAIRLFLQQTVNSCKFPFVPELRQPKTEFKQAIKELDEDQAEHFDDFDSFLSSWEKDK